YQSIWKNRLQYLATITGAITVFFALIAYIVTAWPQIMKLFIWHDRLIITSLSIEHALNGTIVLSSAGDGDLFVSSVSLESNAPRLSINWQVNTVAKVNDFTYKEIRSKAFDEWKTGWHYFPLN